MDILVNILIFWKPIVEILILWMVIYHVMLFFEGTRALQVVRGIILLSFAFLLFQRLGLDRLEWLLTKLFGISVIGILIIFHPEIRQGLAKLGRRHLFGANMVEEEFDLALREISQATEDLAKGKLGALIAIEKNDPLTDYIAEGVSVDAKVSSELIEAIFTPNNPIHDGGMIIQQARVIAAGCLFPLTKNFDLDRIYGTRHRAALGLSEETDAIIIVVSEERQDISLVYHGKMYRDLSQEDLFIKIKEIIKSDQKK
ncbi:MAG: diadenylate cyclase CdaA [Candidatus Omnitrophota bacterium]